MDDKEHEMKHTRTLFDKKGQAVFAKKEKVAEQERSIADLEEEIKACTHVTSAPHQVKYLGLEENVKVRRAGFAYRAEFHRFAERFKLLSPETWPAPFTGTDKKGALAVLRAVRKNIEADPSFLVRLHFGIRLMRPWHGSPHRSRW